MGTLTGKVAMITGSGGEGSFGRTIASTADVAEVAAFLAGDGATYITGQAINVSGGAILH